MGSSMSYFSYASPGRNRLQKQTTIPCEECGHPLLVTKT